MKRDSGSKWQCRKILNSLLPVNTLKNLQLCVGQFYLKKKKKAENNLRNSYTLSKLKNKIKGKERKPHSKTGRNAKTQY